MQVALQKGLDCAISQHCRVAAQQDVVQPLAPSVDHSHVEAAMCDSDGECDSGAAEARGKTAAGSTKRRADT